MKDLLTKSFSVAPFPGWIVVALLVTASLWQLDVFKRQLPLETIDTTDVDALVGNCLGELEMADSLFSDGAAPRAAAFSEACLPPLELGETSQFVVVRSPDPARYGFIEARLNRANLTLEIDEP